ncbi:DUF485 domain-containing protein [Virgibacillus sp. W0430]|uniref:DUF485 domain-containing protein n=1 Tax=Virgibacillus sp. W0430 TaxID=3391580 RepID=UPI003F48856A
MNNLFQQFRQEKKKVNIIAIFILLFFYCSLPTVLTLFPVTMNKASPLFGMTWSWLYAFIQIGMTWILGSFYWRKAKQLDRIAERLRKGMNK